MIRATSGTGVPDPEPAHDIVGDLCRLVRDLSSVERVSVWAYDDARDVIRPYASSEVVAALPRGSRWARIPLEDVPRIRRVLDEGEPLVVDDPHDDNLLPPGMAKDLGLGSFRCEVLHTDRPVGILTLEPSTDALPLDARSVLPTLAAALSEAWARREAERQRETSTLLLDLAMSTMHEEQPSTLLHEACRRLATHLQVNRASIYVQDPVSGDLVPRMSAFAGGQLDPDRFHSFRSSGSPPRLGAALALTEPLALGPDDIDPEWRERYDIGSALIVPFRKPPAVVGILTLDDPEHRRFTDDQKVLASAVAVHVAAIVERAQATTKRELDLRTAEAIRRLLEAGAQAASVEEAAEVLARVAHDVLGAEHSVACLADDTGRIHHVVPVGITPEGIAQIRDLLLGVQATETHLGRVALERREPVYVEDTAESDLLPPEITEPLELRACAAFPLISRTRRLGVVVCAHTSGARRWSSWDRHFAEQLALEGSLVLENALLREAERQRMEKLSDEVDRLAELDRLRQVFLATVSHELRTPVTVISGVMRTILDKKDAITEEMRSKLLERLGANADSLHDLVLRLLDFTRLKEGRLEAHPVPVQLDRVLQGAVDRLQSLLVNHGFSSTVEEGLTVRVDPDLIERVVDNLLTNAVRHTPKGTPIRLEGHVRQDDVVVAVVDEGPGIPEEDLRHLGEIFFRGGHPDRKTSRGLGLGLALAREILHLHGSDLEIESVPGEGASFSFRLPRDA